VLDGLTMKQNRDLQGRRWEQWIRRTLLTLLFAVCLLGLLNVFGQRPGTASSATDRAQLDLYAPAAVRGGLLYETRLTVHARQELKDARLVLDRGWTEGMTINTIEPSPLGEASSDGRLSLDLGHVPAGEEHVVYLQFQVNPTNVGSRSQDVELYDGDEHLLTRSHSIRIFP
jgi:hypothetical protein